MSEDNEQPQNMNEDAQTGQPSLVVNAQYVKDLSFENPNAPKSLMQQSGEPNVEVGVDTSAVKLEGSTFEVTLTIRAEGKSGEETLFMVETSYGGVFTLGETPEEYIALMLYVEAPRLLFPFARAVVAECVRRLSALTYSSCRFYGSISRTRQTSTRRSQKSREPS